MKFTVHKLFAALLVACVLWLPSPPVGAFGIHIGIPNSGGRAGALVSVTFTGMTPGAGTIPAPFSFSRASGATVQTGTSTVVSGIGTDIPRYGRQLDADSVGLVFEESRTNLFPEARTVSSVGGLVIGAGSTFTTGQASPDGTLNGTRFQETSGNIDHYYSEGAITGTRIGSMWELQGSGTGAYQVLEGTSTAAGAAVSGTATAIYQRVTTGPYTYAASGSFLVPQDGRTVTAPGGVAAGNRDSVVDFVQYEAGVWASEAIVTAGASATRAGERLFVSNGANVITSGRLTFSASMRPKGGWQQYSAALYLWRIDANNFARIDNTTGVMTVSVGGVPNTSDALIWNAYDSLDIYVGAGGNASTEVIWRVNAGTVHASTITGAALGTVSTGGGALDVFCNATAGQFSAWITNVSFWKWRDAPAWVSRPFLSYDFTTLAAGAAVNPTGIGFSRAAGTAASETVQTGTSTVVTTGLGVDVGRIGRANSSWSLGWVLEPTRTNLIQFGRDPTAGAPWTAGTTVVVTRNGSLGAAPDGLTATPTRWQVTSGGNSNYQNPATGQTVALANSVWLKQGSGGALFDFSVFGAGAGTRAGFGGTAPAAWTHYILAQPSLATSHGYIPEQAIDLSAVGGIVASNLDAITDMHQSEIGLYATEYIDTTGAANATRQPERLYLTSALNAIVSGQLRMAIRFRAKSSPANADGAQGIWTDGSDFAEVSTAGILTISIGGITNTAPVNWLANDVVDLFVGAGGGATTQVAYRVNGNTAVLPPITGSALAGSLATGGVLDLACNGTSKELASWIYGISFYRPTTQPAWADSPLLWSAVFTSLAPGAVTGGLPGGLSFTRASAATVQIGPSTVVTSGIGTDIPRVGSTDGTTFGLVMEPTRTNLVLQNNDPQNVAWTTVGAPAFSTTTAPDGSTAKIIIDANAGATVGTFQNIGVANTYAASTWYRWNSGSLGILETNAPLVDTFGDTSGAWITLAAVTTTAAADNVGVFPGTGNPVLAANTGQEAYWGTQYEVGKWRSEMIVTAGASATRATERLFHPTTAQLIQSSRIGLDFRFQAKSSPVNQDTSPVLMWLSNTGSDGMLVYTSGLAIVTCGGASDTTAASAMAWNAGDTVEIFSACGGNVPTVLAYRVNGGATVHPALTGSAAASVDSSGSVDLMCYRSNGAQVMASRLYEIDAYRNGFVPYWATQ